MDCCLKYQPHYLWSYLKIRTVLVSLTSLLWETYGLHLARVLMRGLTVLFTHKKMKANFSSEWGETMYVLVFRTLNGISMRQGQKRNLGIWAGTGGASRKQDDGYGWGGSSKGNDSSEAGWGQVRASWACKRELTVVRLWSQRSEGWYVQNIKSQSICTYAIWVSITLKPKGFFQLRLSYLTPLEDSGMVSSSRLSLINLGCSPMR